MRSPPATELKGKVSKSMSIAGRIKKILKISGIVLLTIILLLTAVTTLGVLLADERQMSPWGTGFFYIASGSMEPSLPIGSLVFITSVSADSIKEDDIVTFFAVNGSDIVTHRVREVTANGDSFIYTTRGDANNADDPPLGYSRIIGRVMFSISGTSFIAGMFQDFKYVGLSIIGIGIILCAFGAYSGFKKNKHKTEADKHEKPVESECHGIGDVLRRYIIAEGNEAFYEEWE